MTTLYIDLYRSSCGACNKNADPHEIQHLNETLREPGCGAVYTSLASHYFGVRDSATKMRPDLEWVGLDDEDASP